MKTLCLILLLVSGVCLQAALVEPPASLTDFESANIILLIEGDHPKDFFTTGTSQASFVATFLKGGGDLKLPFFSQAYPIPEDAHDLLLFLRSNDGKLEPINTTEYIIASSRLTPDNVRELKSFGITKTLAKVLANETSSGCELQQADLLAGSSDKDALAECWNSLRTRKDADSTMQLAALDVGLRAVGVDALKEVHAPFATSKSGSEWFYGNTCLAGISSWIIQNAKGRNSERILEFSQTQHGDLRAACLCAISRYVSSASLPKIIEIFGSDGDPKVQYGCVKNLSKIFDKSVPTIDDFLQHKEEFLRYWKTFLTTHSSDKISSE